MSRDEARNAAPSEHAERRRDHHVPRFEGAESRRHQPRRLATLRAEAAWLSLRHRAALAGVRTFVQFAGWPRSGHSLVGALIDAHPAAAISHELDTMGLFHKGIHAARLPALCLGNSAAFTRAGRYWNGFCYAVPGALHGPSGRLKVVGDKKGDWATRWSAFDPALVARLAAESPFDCRWILVTRHPADNIATMSLRRGGGYDRLRISGRGDIGDAIREAQRQGRIAAEADDEMIADYRALAASVARMRTRIPPENWLDIAYERFAEQPHEGLERLAAFLGLDPDPGWRNAAAALVRPSTRRSRDSVSWREDQRARVAATIAEHDFLSVYGDEA